MRKLFYLFILSILLTSCSDSKTSQLKKYSYEIEVVYENGDSETILISKDSYEIPTFRLVESGCLRVYYTENPYRQEDVVCYLRKYNIISENIENN